MKIKDCQILDAITCLSTEKLSKVAAILRDKKIRHIYVILEDKKLVGVVAAIDLVYNIMAEEKDYLTLTAGDVMKKEVMSFSKEDELTKPIGFMSKSNIMTVPITEDEKIIGVVFYKDVVNKIMEAKQNNK